MHASSSISSSEASLRDQARADRAAFLRDLAVRIAPVLVLPALYCTLVLLADPYDFFHLPVSVSSPEIRARFAEPANPALAQFLRFRAAPKPDILLGDSRMAILKPEAIREQTGRDIASLAIPGATFDTILDAFWLADEITPLRSVLIGVAFDSYNDFRIGSEIGTVRSITENPLLYFTNQNVLSSTIAAYQQRLGLGVSNKYQLSSMTKDEIWNGMRNYYSNSLKYYRDPVRFRVRLLQIANLCRARGIELRFVILPQFDEATELIQEYKLSDEFAAMKQELGDLAVLVDLSAPSPLTADRSRFSDILHFGPERDFRLIPRIWPPKSPPQQGQ